MTNNINLVIFFGFLLLSHLVRTSIADKALLRVRRTEATDNGEKSHRVLQFFHWWDCNLLTEQPCFDEYWNIISCAPYAEGGCKCPPGQQRCGANAIFIGYCASLCCDHETEYSCWEMTENFKFDVTSCSDTLVGCLCPEGQTKCGYDKTPSGLCSPVCCDANTEVFCSKFDGTNYTAYCGDLDEGC
ncbi:hypothetical protein ACHAW6_015195 [Cyclotella cf. meneghiniana]